MNDLVDSCTIANISDIVGYDSEGLPLGQSGGQGMSLDEGMGMGKDGIRLTGQSNRALVEQGRRWAEHVAEPWSVSVLVGAYIFISVAFGLPLWFVAIHIIELSIHIIELSMHINELAIHIIELSIHINELVIHIIELAIHIIELSIHIIELAIHIIELAIHIIELSIHINELAIHIIELGFPFFHFLFDKQLNKNTNILLLLLLLLSLTGGYLLVRLYPCSKHVDSTPTTQHSQLVLSSAHWVLNCTALL